MRVLKSWTLRPRSAHVISFLLFLLLINLYYYLCWYKTEYIRENLPEALVIGAKKAGTGALRSFLKRHPDLNFNCKEIHFFTDVWRLPKGYRWYVNQFEPKANKSQLRMEKTPSYFHNRVAAPMIRNMNPKLKLILVVRDPVKRTISDHMQEEASKMRHSKTIERKLLDWSGNINQNAKIIWPSFYAKHVKRFLDYFPRDQLHIVDGDSLIKKNPSVELKKIEQFLNVSQFFTTDKFVFSQQKGFYCFKEENRTEECLGEGKGRKHDSVDESTIVKLKELFKPHNKEFFEITGLHFDWD